MKTVIDIALDCMFKMCGLSTECKYMYTWCSMKSCTRARMTEMSIDMVIKGEY